MADRPLSIRHDFNTDVLWKPPRLGTRTRTVSTDSTTSDNSLAPTPSNTRRFSLSEYFGTNFLHRQRSMDSGSVDIPVDNKPSLTESADFQEFLRRQKRILE